MVFTILAALFLAFALTFTMSAALQIFVAIHYQQAFTFTAIQQFLIGFSWALFILFKFWL